MIESCLHGRLDFVTVLLDHGVDSNVQNGKALVNAMKSGNIELIKFLMSKGVDIEIYGYKMIKTTRS